MFVRMGIASAGTLFGLFHLLLFPTPPAIINVAWSPNVTSTQIVDLEQRHKLEPLQRVRARPAAKERTFVPQL